MQFITKILSIVLCFVFYSFPAYAKTYINGIDASYPPFAYVNDQGKPDGLDIKAMDWIAKEMGFKVKHRAVTWSSVIDSLVSGEIDMVCSGMSITEERKRRVRFTDPYHEVANVFAVHKDSKLTVEEIYTTPIRLGIQRGTADYIAFEQGKFSNNYQYRLFFYSSAPLALDNLANKRIDAAAVDIFPAQDAINKNKDIKILDIYSDSDFFGVAVRRNAEDDKLYNLVNEGYKRLQKDPYWEELKRIYLH